MKRFERMERLVEVLGTEGALEELVRAMSDDQMEELYNGIARDYDLEEEEE